MGYTDESVRFGKPPQEWVDYYKNEPLGYNRSLIEIDAALDDLSGWDSDCVNYYKQMPPGYDRDFVAEGKCPKIWCKCLSVKNQGYQEYLEYERELLNLGIPYYEENYTYHRSSSYVGHSRYSPLFGVEEEDIEDPNYWSNL
jgi:hypothetical protein